jgi:hypothetical protein
MVLLKSDRESKLSPSQVEMRNDLEAAIEELRPKKTMLSEDDYYESLEVILVEIANIYEGDSTEELESGTSTAAEAENAAEDAP